MKINLRSAQTGSGAYTVFAADSASGGGDIIEWVAPQLDTAEYIAEGYGATSRTVLNLGNGVWTATALIRKFYSTNVAARQAIATLGATLSAGQVDVQVFDSNSSDATYLPAASITSFKPDTKDGQRGTAVYFTLKITGPNYTTTAP